MELDLDIIMQEFTRINNDIKMKIEMKNKEKTKTKAELSIKIKTEFFKNENETRLHFTDFTIEEIQRVSFLWLDNLLQRACGFYPVTIFDVNQDCIDELNDLSILDSCWTSAKIKLLSWNQRDRQLDLILYPDKLIMNSGPVKTNDFDILFDHLGWSSSLFYQQIQVAFESCSNYSIEKQAWFQLALACWFREFYFETKSMSGRELCREWKNLFQNGERDFLGSQARNLVQIVQYAIDRNFFRKPTTQLVDLCRKYPPIENEWVEFFVPNLTSKGASFAVLIFYAMSSVLGRSKSISLVLQKLHPFGPQTFIKVKIFCNMLLSHIIYKCFKTPNFDLVDQDLCGYYNIANVYVSKLDPLIRVCLENVKT